MTAQPSALDFQSIVPTEFSRIRSEFIDEFSRLEIAVGRGLQKLGLEFDPRKCSFDQLVEKLSKAKPSPKLSKKNAAELARLAGVCHPFQNLRASMVHSIMEMVTRDDQALVPFRNVADVLHDMHVCYALTSTDLRGRIESLPEITRQVEKTISPSSPPPPRPAAAAGP